MNLLIVEDETPKLNNITDLAKEIGIFNNIDNARSVSSSLKSLRGNAYNLVILDMSLPTFDIGNGESGGRPQGFGGQEVLRYMDRFKMVVPVVVVTAFEAFAGQGKAIDLKTLESSLRIEHSKIFGGIVFYNTEFLSWRDSLRGLITSILDKK